MGIQTHENKLDFQSKCECNPSKKKKQKSKDDEKAIQRENIKTILRLFHAQTYAN